MTTIETSRTTDTGRRAVRQAGAWLVGGALVWLTQPLVPVISGEPDAGTALFEYQTERDGLVAIGEHTAVWVAMNLPLGIGTVLALIGLVVLTRALRTAARSRVINAAIAAALVGGIAWIVEILGRVTVVAVRGREAVDDPTVGGDGPYLGLSLILLFLAHLVLIAFAVFGWVLARRRLPGRVSGVLVAVLATTGAIAGIASFTPIVAYAVGVLPMGLLLLIGLRRRAVPTGPGTP